jgi:hypothetical protein|nr:MAG TPA: hypothetical protein [Caudoviricetes sp.]
MREYEKIILYTNDAVMYKMKNGWFYLVSTRLDEIPVFHMAMKYMRHQPYFNQGEPPEALLKATNKLLQELPLNPNVYRKLFENEETVPFNDRADF